jgi:hypothetical protein
VSGNGNNFPSQLVSSVREYRPGVANGEVRTDYFESEMGAVGRQKAGVDATDMGTAGNEPAKSPYPSRFQIVVKRVLITQKSSPTHQVFLVPLRSFVKGVTDGKGADIRHVFSTGLDLILLQPELVDHHKECSVESFLDGSPEICHPSAGSNQRGCSCSVVGP